MNNSRTTYLIKRTIKACCAFSILVGCTVLPSSQKPTSSPVPMGNVPTAAVTVLPKSDRPNILLIVADDLDAKLNTISYMPHLQELLVHQGLTIQDFFVTDSVCCPSRATILRGQYAHNHHVYTNDVINGGFVAFYSQHEESSTIATWLQAAGYETIFLGKYFNGYPTNDNRLYIPSGWDEWYSPIKGNPYKGLNYDLNENGTVREYGTAEEDYLLDVLSGKAQDYLRRTASDNRPFFMYITPYQPHQPATPAPRHANEFNDLQAPRTPSFNEADVSDKPSLMNSDAPLRAKQIDDLDNLYRLRVQSMQSVDEMILNLVNTLQETGELENTILIFTSDNGFHLGQHRMPAGKGTTYDEDILVPFIIRGPNIQANKVVAGYLSGNVDLAPTIAELAGVIPPENVDGRSLVPLFEPEPPDVSLWRQAFLLELFAVDDETASLPQLANLSGNLNGILEPPDLDQLYSEVPTPIFRGLRTKDYAYIEYSDGFVELYDMVKDPDQMENMAGTANPDLLKQFSSWLKELLSCAGNTCRTEEVHPKIP